MRRAGLAVLAIAALTLGACFGPRRYEARGIVRDFQREYAQVLIEHEDIPGLMPAMTMNFDLADPAMLDDLQRGQIISFDLEFDGSSYRVTDFEVLGFVGDPGVPVLDGIVTTLDPAPPFDLTDQDGKPVSLASLAGKAVLLDFIYTQCPGPCPTQTARNVAVQRKLPASLHDRVHFVSITIDPRNDDGPALAAYAKSLGVDPSNWSFLTGDVETVEAVVRAYGAPGVRAEDGSIDHVLATFLIDGRGRVVERYVGGGDASADIARDVARVAAAGDGA
jgi:protein SCO1/2